MLQGCICSSFLRIFSFLLKFIKVNEFCLSVPQTDIFLPIGYGTSLLSIIAVQSHYKTPHYNMDFDIAWSQIFFTMEFYQKHCRKMAIKYYIGD